MQLHTGEPQFIVSSEGRRVCIEFDTREMSGWVQSLALSPMHHAFGDRAQQLCKS